MWTLLWIAFLPSIILAYELDWKKLDGLARAKVECVCSLTVFFSLSHNLELKYIPGADPELILLNHYYKELDRIPLSFMTRMEINSLLVELGFYKKAHSEDDVPEEFRFAPAKDSPFPENHINQPEKEL
ncbi:Selenoprotein M [Bagarius yarrelli]|uniref:Selenoprotein M n=1 Tax=Bagarius yarrelli TaxID=175774 RepID=A0A556V6N0_BAGYA|nr:Selenoprotein M [Bagarius yarrelli]